MRDKDIAMLTPPLLEEIIPLLQRYEQEEFAEHQTVPVAGGDINTSYLLATPQRRYFIKILNRHDASAMHRAEAEGLGLLAQNARLIVPEVVGQGAVGAVSFLILHGLELGGASNWSALGDGLADLHRQTSASFGGVKNNFIGTTLQRNGEHDQWCDFWWQQRLLPQLTLAYSKGYYETLKAKEEPLRRASRRLLEEHQPVASLVHGDLWSGNVGFMQNSQPAIFDPACYFGDREVDIAMSQLFGGFGTNFYRAYQTAWPLDDGYQQRFVLYNLYHLLNHLNLFGRGYLNQCLSSMEQLTAREPLNKFK